MKARKHENRDVEILIAEDSPTQAERLKHTLEGHGYTVSVAADGRRALAAARRRKPTLIVSDIVMPEMDGYALAKAVKSDAKLKDIPFVLLTTLSDPRDVIVGLESGADNFIRKPYDERYLLSRIDYLLMNLELRKNQKMQMGVEIDLGGQKHFITAERQQILDLLISTYEQATYINQELKTREAELAHSNHVLHGLYRIAEGLNQATTEREAAELALQRSLDLPGVQAGWISLREGESGFRLVATCNLPPALDPPGALEGGCACRRRLLAGDLDSVTNIVECERLQKATGDTRGLRYHAAVPLWIGDRTVGLMNLTGPQEGLFTEEELKVLYGVGNQVAVALERARLRENLEKLVAERTAALTAEIAERRRAEETLRESELNYRIVADFTYDWEFWMAPEGRFTYLSPSCHRVSGYAPREFGDAASLLEIVHGEDREQARVELTRALSQEVQAGFEFRIVMPDGLVRWVEMAYQPAKNATGAFVGVRGSIRDITRRKEQEARILRLNRVYAVLSGINTAIVRTGNRQELFGEACRIAVEHGGFRMAWIGLLDPNGVDVTPAAKAGLEEGYLENMRLTARDDVADGCKIVAQALREGAAVVCNDIDTDPRMARWREEAMRRGYRSLAVFPLQTGTATVGLLLLYAPEKDSFDSEEMRLLGELAADISFALDHIEKAERLDYLAYYNALTGLPNRALFYDRVNQLLHAKAPDSGRKIAVVLLDLERFHAVNDTFGRGAGDAVLMRVAERLSAASPGSENLARIGGDGFAMVLSDIEKEEEVLHFVHEVAIGALQEPVVVDGHQLRIAARAGIAFFPADGGDVDTLFRNAEAALKNAELSGERYRFYTPQINARAAERLTLENKLRYALEREQLVLHYQPKVDLKSGRISGLEALMRWSDPDFGSVSPARFIPILEETGMILEAGRWALDRAVGDSRRWRAAGLQVPRIAVNVSQVQLRQKDFVAVVERALGGAAGATEVLDLEITETLIMHDIEENIAKFRAVKEMGVGIAIDDFGTGYSSLSYIARLPINSLKIDRAFIMNLTKNPGDVSIVTTIISLAHSLDLKVVAEGVETREQANLLRLLKCDEMQGYLFSPAVAGEQIEAFLREGESLAG